MTAVYVSLIWCTFFLICFLLSMRSNAVKAASDGLMDDLEQEVQKLKRESIFCLEAVTHLKEVVTALQSQNEDLKRIAEETKKLSSETHLAMGFKRLGKRE